MISAGYDVVEALVEGATRDWFRVGDGHVARKLGPETKTAGRNKT